MTTTRGGRRERALTVYTNKSGTYTVHCISEHAHNAPVVLLLVFSFSHFLAHVLESDVPSAADSHVCFATIQKTVQLFFSFTKFHAKQIQIKKKKISRVPQLSRTEVIFWIRVARNCARLEGPFSTPSSHARKNSSTPACINHWNPLEGGLGCHLLKSKIKMRGKSVWL